MLSETPVLNQITGLVRRGHEVDIFGDRPKSPSACHPSIDELGLLNRAFYRPDLPPTTAGRWARGLTLVKQASGADRAALLRSMNVFRFGTRSATGRLALQTAQFLPARSYDVIQAGFGEQGLKALRMKRVGAISGPLVTAFRGADLTRFLARRGKNVYRSLFRAGDLFMPVSQLFAERLVSMGCPPSRVAVHRTGIDVRRFTFQPKQPGAVVRLISIGRLVEKKGIIDALHALRLLLREGVAMDYTIVGEGPLRGSLESAARELQLERVHFTGALPQESVLEQLEAADILIAPSVTAADGDEEGIPNVLKEAMAIGRPVISTRHSGIPELIEHGGTGLLANEHDPEGLAANLKQLLAGREGWPALLDRARRTIASEYDIETLNDRLVEHYRRITSGTVSG